jgi:Tfp pilus assembly protein PilX
MFAITDERGIALVLALILLAVLSVLALAMVSLGRHETTFLIKERLSDAALYIADGGVEYGINELQKDPSTYRGPTTYSVGNGGQFTVSVSTQGQPANHYAITSTGYVPDATNPQETRTVSSVVNIVPGTPTYAIGAKEGITVASNITVRGDLRSDGQITLGNNVFIEPSSAGASDGSIYTSTDIAKGVNITGNLYMQPGREIRSRGPTNAEMGGDTAETGIYQESRIKAGDPLIVEGDTSGDTAPIGSYNSVDLAALDNMDKIVYDAFQDYTSNETFYLDGKVHKFTEGVRFSSNITFEGEGTIWVSGGSGRNYGLELCSNVFGPDGGYASVNLICSGGTWNEADIKINSNVKINGLISGQTEVDANSNVEINGVIESGGTINVNSNVTIQWGEFGFQVPITGSPATTIVRSWQEL